jgi:hypothetical protein
MQEVATGLALCMPAVGFAQAPDTPSQPHPLLNALAHTTSYKMGETIAENYAERISEYQLIENDKARRESRERRNLSREVKEGLFFIPDPFAVGEPTIELSFSSEHLQLELQDLLSPPLSTEYQTIELNAEVARLLHEAWESPTTFEEKLQWTRDRRLSPIELQVQIAIYKDICATQQARYPFMEAEQFANALQNFQDWVGPIPHRPPNHLVKQYRSVFAENLRTLGAHDAEYSAYLEAFDSFYASLPTKQFLANSTTKSRLLKKYQAAETEQARQNRGSRNIEVEFNKGTFFSPDLDPNATIAMRPFDPPFDLANLELRPSPTEQTSELKHLRQLLAEMNLSSEVAQEVISLRQRAWQEMPEAFPERITNLLWRTPGKEELEVILAFYDVFMQRENIDYEIRDARLNACRDYYTSRPQRAAPLDEQTRNDIRDNFKAMMLEVGFFSEADVENKLNRFDREYQ